MHATNLKFCLIFLAMAGAPLLINAQVVAPDGDIDRATQLILEGNQSQAEALLESLSAKGNKDATTMLGAIWGSTGRTKEAIRLLEPIARAGNSEAQWHLFRAHSLAVPPNVQLADYWLKRAAAEGNPKAAAVLKRTNDAPPDREGKVSTSALVSSIRATVAEKVAAFSDKTVDCYGVSRSELTGIFDRSLDTCVGDLPAEQKVRVIPSHQFVQSLTSCTNAKLFEMTKRAPNELAACFAKN